MKKITLINPSWFFSHPRNIIIPNNLGVGYLASFLEANGNNVKVINSLLEGLINIKKVKGRYQYFYQVGLDYPGIVSRIPPDTDFIGISAPFTNHARIVRELAIAVKNKFPQIPIVLGGAYPSLSIDQALCKEIDYYVIGEGENPFLSLISGYCTEGTKGIIKYGEKKIVQQAEVIKNLDELPFPKRDRLSITSISQRRERRRSAPLITSRGCPFDCNFCSIHLICGNNWRSRSSQNVLEEIKYLISEFGVEHIEFEDDNLTLDRNRAVKIFEGITEINRGKNKLSWSTPNGIRVDSLDREMLMLIKRSGCLSLSLGVESGDPKILELMKKKLDLEKVIEIVGICKELKLRTNIFLMIGYPGEDKSSFLKTCEFVKKLKNRGADVFYPGITRAYPGTALFELCSKNNYLPPINKREDIFLGNIITPGNAIITPDFNPKVLRNRFSRIEKMTVPFYLRLYHNYFHIIKKIIPDRFIQFIKRALVRNKSH